MKTWKQWAFAAIIAFFGIIVGITACGDGGATGSNTTDDPNNGNTTGDPNNGNAALYTVTFSTNGSMSIYDAPPGAQTVTAGASITLPSLESSFSKSDSSGNKYSFDGWNTDSSGTGTNYNAGSSYTVTGNITLYAKWELIIVPFVTGTYYYGVTDAFRYITFSSDGTYTYTNYYVSTDSTDNGTYTYTVSDNTVFAAGLIFTVRSSTQLASRSSNEPPGYGDPFLWTRR